MRYTIENLNEDLAQALTSVAQSNHRSFDEEIIDALKSRAQAALRNKAALDLEKRHKEWLEERGGVPFPDSVEIIRDMRTDD